MKEISVVIGAAVDVTATFTTAPTTPACVASKGATEITVTLSATDDPLVFTGEFVPTAAGRWAVLVTSLAPAEAAAAAIVQVIDPRQ